MADALVVIAWLKANAAGLVGVLTAFVTFAEAVVRLTPTQTDDGFVTRIGIWIDKLLSWLPNNVKNPPPSV